MTRPRLDEAFPAQRRRPGWERGREMYGNLQNGGNMSKPDLRGTNRGSTLVKQIRLISIWMLSTTGQENMLRQQCLEPQMTAPTQECKRHSPESPPPFQQHWRQLRCCVMLRRGQRRSTGSLGRALSKNDCMFPREGTKQVCWSTGGWGGCWGLRSLTSTTESRCASSR